MQIDHGSFTPHVMSAAGGMSRECWKLFTHLSVIISEKRNLNYSTIATWISR